MVKPIEGSSSTDFNLYNYWIDQDVENSESIELVLIDSDSHAFNLFTHGRPGELWIEGEWKDAENITQWLKKGNFLYNKSQLNIYGCEFAKGKKGRQAVSYLETALFVSIAASDNITGKDGDWNLEIGENESSIKIPHYQHHLQVTPPMNIVPPTDIVLDSDAGYLLGTGTGTVFGVTVNDSGIIGTAGNFDTYRGLEGPNLMFHESDFNPATSFNNFVSNTTIDNDVNNYIYALRSGDFVFVDYVAGSGTRDLYRIESNGLRTKLNPTTGWGIDIYDIVEHPTLDDVIYVSTRTNTGGTYRIYKMDASTGVIDTGFTLQRTGSGAATYYDIDFASNGNLLVAQQTLGMREYDPTTGTLVTTYSGIPSSTPPQTFKIQSDGKIVFGGYNINTTNYKYLGRLNTDGTLDNTFAIHNWSRSNTGASTANATVSDIEINSNDEIYISGSFSHLMDGISIGSVAKLNADGTFNTDFINNIRNVGASGITGNLPILDIQLQSDGKLLVAGNFQGINSLYHAGLIRLLPNGVLDTPLNSTAPETSLKGLNVLNTNTNRHNKGVIYRSGEKADYNTAGYHPTYYGKTNDQNKQNPNIPTRYDAAEDKFIVGYTGVSTAGIVAHDTDGDIIWSLAITSSTQNPWYTDITKDGNYYAVGSPQATRVKVYNANTGALIQTLNTGTYTDIGFDPSGTYLYVLNSYGSLLARWDYINGTNLGTVNTNNPNQSNSTLRMNQFEFYSDTELYLMKFISNTNDDYIWKATVVDGSNNPSSAGNTLLHDVNFGAVANPGRLRVRGDGSGNIWGQPNASKHTVGEDGNLFITGARINGNPLSGPNIVRVGPVGVDVENDYILVASTGSQGAATGTNSLNAVLLDWGSVSCKAGTTDPTTSGSASNICPSTTADISGLITSTCPAGSTSQWHDVSVNPSVSTLVLDPTAVGAGTYYAYCYDSLNDCYSPASTGLVVTVTNCNTTIAMDDFINTPIGVPVTSNVLTNDNDEEGDVQTVTIGTVMPSSEGTVTLLPNGTYIFTPGTGFFGETSFEYVVCDNGSPQACETGTVYIEVLPNPTSDGQPPVANPDVNEVEEGQTAMGDVLANDYDPDGTSVTVNSITVDTDGDAVPDLIGTVGNAITVAGIDEDGNTILDAGTLILDTDGSYTFTPTMGFVGEIIVEYEIIDEDNETDNTILAIVVNLDNGNTTFASDDAAVTDAGIPVSGNVRTNDYDPEGHATSINGISADTDGDGEMDDVVALGTATTIYGYNDLGVLAPAGTIELDGLGDYTYRTAIGFIGSTVLTYEICDGQGTPACDEATLSLSVQDVNRDYGDAPTKYEIVWHRSISDDNNDRVLDGTNDVWLGDYTDFEKTTGASPTADSDLYDDGMSFGVNEGQFPTVLNPSTTYNVDVVVNSTSAMTVHYGMWIDYDNDGTYDQFYSGMESTTGKKSASVAITTPSDLLNGSGFTGTVNVRLRVDDTPFAIGDSGGARTNGEVEDFQNTIVLPVELLYFEVEDVACLNELYWATESEMDNHFFIVEYSKNGEDFIPLERVEGSGNSSERIEYTYTHHDVEHVDSYYRLLQVDYDGSMEYSDVIFVKSDCEDLNSDEIHVYPNPSKGDVKVDISNNTGMEKEVEIMVTDAMGRILKRKEVILASGMNRNEIDLFSFPTGVYMLSVIDEKGHKIESFMVSLITD